MPRIVVRMSPPNNKNKNNKPQHQQQRQQQQPQERQRQRQQQQQQQQSKQLPRRRIRRSTPCYLRWLSFFTAIAVIRTIWNSADFTLRQSSSWSTSSAFLGGDYGDVPRSAIADFDASVPQSPQGQHSSIRNHQRASEPQHQQERQSRSRVQRPHRNPSRKSLESALLVLPSGKTTSVKDDSSIIVQQQPSVEAKKAKDGDSYWKHLCQGGKDKHGGGKGLSSNSRVLISGILSHTVVVELALALSSHCHVKTIVGLSNLAPNADDSDVPPRLSYLLRRLPQFQFLHRDTLFSQERFHKLMASVEPTHVVHFEATTFLPPDSLATMPPIFQVRESLETLDRLGRAIVTWQTTNKEDSSSVVRWLYVSTPLLPNKNDPTSSSSMLYPSRSLDLAYPVLLQTFRAHYNLDVLHVKLPYIYGPFHESDLSLPSLVGLPDTSTRQHNQHRLAHVADCVESLLASLSSPKLKVPTLPQVQVPPSSVTTTNEILRTFLNATGPSSSSFKLREERAKLILSWHHQDVFPFEEPNDHVYSDDTRSIMRKALAMTNRRLRSDATAGISQLQQRQNALFPCHSECAVNSPCREASVFNEIFPISQNLTQLCRFVVYMTDFSRETSDLPRMPEAAEIDVRWPKDLLCQVAFVSGKSSLVRMLMEKEKEASSKRKVDMRSLNGSLKYNNWSIIWLPEDDDASLSEADYLFPKLSPRPFFAHNVTKSLYVQPAYRRQSQSSHVAASSPLPPLPVIWFLLAKQMDAKRSAERVKHQKRSGTGVSIPVTLAATPARHMALFAHSMGIPSEQLLSNSMKVVAKFVLKRKGIEDYATRALPHRQLEYYDFAKTWYDFAQIPDTYLLIHNLESDRSRRLRCEWYEEHLFWADDYDYSNRELEDLSLAHVLARWRAERRLVAHDDYAEQWGDRIVDTIQGDLLDHMVYNASEVHLQPSQYFVKLHTRGVKVPRPQ